MWVDGGCRGFFRCNNGPSAVKCGFMGASNARANYSCGSSTALTRHEAGCGARAYIASVGDHVSSDFRRLPQPPKTDPSVKCCQPPSRGTHDNRTLAITRRGTSQWPEDCEAFCTGDCQFFSHSLFFRNCMLCNACNPEIPIGDGSWSSFERVSQDPTILYTGVKEGR